jgi:adenosylcobinamide-GDP ribazoletransferase
MTGVMAWVPSARPAGLASPFAAGRGGRWVVLAGLALSAGLAVAWRPGPGAVAVAAGTMAAGGVVWLAWRRIGGYTGDVLGAAGVVGETVGLLVAAARW